VTARGLGSVLAIAVTVWALVPVLTETAKPLADQPFPDSAEYADSAWELAHAHGYVTFVNERAGWFGHVARPPRYPFGTSAVLAPFAAVGSFPQDVQFGARVISAAYVVAIVLASWMLAGPLAAAVAGLFVGLSPFAHVSAGLILSDPLAALITVLMLIALHVGSRRAMGIAGALGGVLVCVRLLGVVSLPALFLAVPRNRRWLVVLCAAPFLAILAAYQWKTFGSPFLTGYSYWVPSLHTFDLAYAYHVTSYEGPFVIPDKLSGHLLDFVCPCGIGGSMTKLPNLTFYPAVVAGLFWVFAPPLTGLIGLVEMWRNRASPAARFAIITVVLNVALVLFYFDQAARFIAPAVSLILVYSAVGLVRVLGWLGREAAAAAQRRGRLA
jgi:4-amino-4-deoxy-L-arabinose transferase-like glycosyltransferase